MIFNFPLIIHNEEGFWGEFPDVIGCNCSGDSLDEILDDAKKALNLHLLCMIMDDEPLPKATYPTQIATDKDSFVTIISVELDVKKKDTSIKKTLTIPKWLNDKAIEQNINFSKTLQDALIKKMV